MVAASETTIFDVGANGGIDAAAFDYLGRLVPTDVPAVIERLLARSRLRLLVTDSEIKGSESSARLPVNIQNQSGRFGLALVANRTGSPHPIRERSLCDLDRPPDTANSVAQRSCSEPWKSFVASMVSTEGTRVPFASTSDTTIARASRPLLTYTTSKVAVRTRFPWA
jgi:hypothetical protein